MARTRTASPGRGSSTPGRSVTRMRIGVVAGSQSPTRIGASSSRWPPSPGEAMSTTQASTHCGRAPAWATGAFTASARSLATANPPTAQAASTRVMVMPRVTLQRVAASRAATTGSSAQATHAWGSRIRPK